MRFTAVLGLSALMVAGSANAQEGDAVQLIGELMAFHASESIVEVMATHCYETTGLDPVYQVAAENWYLRNVGYLDLADRVIDRLGGGADGQLEQVQTYAGSQIMSAYNQAESKDTFCRAFLERVDNGELDIDQQLPDALKRAQEIAAS